MQPGKNIHSQFQQEAPEKKHSLPLNYEGVQSQLVHDVEKGELLWVLHKHRDGGVDVSVSEFPAERFIFSVRDDVMADCYYISAEGQKSGISPDLCRQQIGICEKESGQLGFILPQITSPSPGGGVNVTIGAHPVNEMAGLSIHNGVPDSYKVCEKGHEIQMNLGFFLEHFQCPANFKPDIKSALQKNKNSARILSFAPHIKEPG